MISAVHHSKTGLKVAITLTGQIIDFYRNQYVIHI